MGSGESTPQSTNVSNAYEDEIWVKVSCVREDVILKGFERYEKEGYNQERKFDNRFNREYAIRNQFINIAPQKSLTFDTDPNQAQFYISIFSGGGLVICNCHCKNKSSCFIVDDAGYLQDSVGGGSWIDANGKNHKTETTNWLRVPFYVLLLNLLINKKQFRCLVIDSEKWIIKDEF